MPGDKYNSLKDDADHIGNKNPEKKMPTSSPKPSDLGKGQARKAVEAVLARRKELDEI